MKWDEPSRTDPYSSTGRQLQSKVIALAQEFVFKMFHTEIFEPTQGHNSILI